MELSAGQKVDHRQNKVAYITGSSRGIGKALVLKLLSEGYSVFGISRSNELEHENYSFIQCDLSDIESVAELQFNTIGAESTLLVNNAGIVGEIGPVGTQDWKSISNLHAVNTIAPQILMNSFLSRLKGESGTKHILNISSGAGKYAIDAWSAYCSSKAALDLYSEVLKQEQSSRNEESIIVHSVSPGVVDTEMQSDIRSADPEKFLESAKFHALKANNELSSPTLVADKLYQIISNPGHFPNNLVSLRDF